MASSKITVNPDKIEIIPPRKGVFGQLETWWKSKLGKLGITSFTLGGIKSAIDIVQWLLDFRGRSQEAMTWVRELSTLLHRLPHIPEWVNVILLAFGIGVLMWDNRRRHKLLLASHLEAVQPPMQSKSESIPLSPLNAPSIVLEYRWRNFNETGHPDPLNMPLQFRNLGKDTAVNVELEIRYLKWVAKFPTIPHLAPGESKSVTVNIEYDGYDFAEVSAGHQFISVVKPPGEDALKQSRRVPAIVKYRDMQGNDFVSEYEFRWDHEKQEAVALLMRYGKPHTDNEVASAGQVPDVALVWDWPDDVKRNLGLLGKQKEKDILIHNRSGQYIYNVQIEPIKLAQELTFDLINEIAPTEKHLALGRWNGKSSLTTEYVYFFGNQHNAQRAFENKWIFDKVHQSGVSDQFYKIPMAVLFESNNIKWRCKFEFICDIGDESLFQIL